MLAASDLSVSLVRYWSGNVGVAQRQVVDILVCPPFHFLFFSFLFLSFESFIINSCSLVGKRCLRFQF